MSAAPALTHILTVTFTTVSTTSPGHHTGAKSLVNVTGGTFMGTNIAGRVLAGADWVTVRPDGVLELDVRAQLVTDDGTTILMTYTGVATPADGGLAIVMTPRFDAPADSAHSWLNNAVGVGIGSLGEGSVTYEVYAASAP